jgi:hypothetical protein
MAGPALLRRLVVGAIVVAATVGCTTAGLPPTDGAGPSEAASASPAVSASVGLESTGPPSADSISAGPSASWSSDATTSTAVAAAARLLASDSARFELEIRRSRPNLPEDLTAAASGVVDPAGDRGRMRYELFPNDPDGSPFALGPFDIAWDATDYWTTVGPDDLDGAWQHTTRAHAQDMALIGRVNEEPLALLRFAAAADPDAMQASPAQLNGRAAERWLISVPAETAGEAYVPPETYLAFSQVFGRPDLPLEVWLVEGEVARVGYVLEREQAPYGGPDRIETWYDWSDVGEPIVLVTPPAGTVVEIGG